MFPGLLSGAATSEKAIDSWDLAECDTSTMFNIGPLEATVVVGFFLAIGLLIRSLVRR
jgi:hypothetical protein